MTQSQLLTENLLCRLPSQQRDANSTKVDYKVPLTGR